MRHFFACVLVLVLTATATKAQPPGLRLFPRHADGKWGYVGPGERFAVDPQFDLAAPFSEGLAAIEITGRWGYIDSVGEFAVIPRFQLAGPFSEGLAFFRPFGLEKFGFINSSGESVIPPQFDWAGSFRGGLAPVKDGEQFGFVDARGEIQIKPVFSRVGLFSEGLAAAQIEGKYGFIDPRGNFLIKPRYVEVQEFAEGRAWVRSDNLWSCITERGTPAFDGAYERTFPFDRGYSVVRVDGKYGVINSRGNFVVQPSAETVVVNDEDRVVAMGSGDRMMSHNVVDNKIVSEVRTVPWIKPVKLLSVPKGARVFRVTWLQRKYASSMQELMTDRHSVPEGDNTDVVAWLDERKVWTIIFQKDGKIREKNCIPGINASVRVDY